MSNAKHTPEIPSIPWETYEEMLARVKKREEDEALLRAAIAKAKGE